MYSQHCFTANAGKTPIKVEDFAEHLAMLQSNIHKQFRIDYESLVSDTEYTFHAARLAANSNKNRYRNILPCNLIYYHCLFSQWLLFIQMITPEWFWD